jgi:hypothetical protein
MRNPSAVLLSAQKVHGWAKKAFLTGLVLDCAPAAVALYM